MDSSPGHAKTLAAGPGKKFPGGGAAGTPDSALGAQHREASLVLCRSGHASWMDMPPLWEVKVLQVPPLWEVKVQQVPPLWDVKVLRLQGAHQTCPCMGVGGAANHVAPP